MKLIKNHNGIEYALFDSDGTSIGIIGHNLSLKNCETIENGYDLDELALKHADLKIIDSDERYYQGHKCDKYDSFKTGFQKALELLGDKKFSEEDLRKALDEKAIHFEIYSNEFGVNGKYTKSDEEIIQSLQQTEWDVEIVMETPPATYGHSGWHKQPKLDENGCIILKRK